MRSVYLETYGCQMNVADSELMAGVLEAAGMRMVDAPEEADAILLNTCAIREHAEQRVLRRLEGLASLKRRRPGLVVGIAGCMAQHLRQTLRRRSPVLDLVVGPDGYRRLPELLRGAGHAPTAATRLDRDETYGDLEPRRGAGMRAWVTVQRGCDKFCTYCVVPYTRGRERSLPLSQVIEQVRRAVAQGFVEVVFLGQTVNSYHDGEHRFSDLLRAAAELEGLARIRYTSPHPADFDERLIAAHAELPKLCPHVHLPLQSASNRVLEAMDRTYSLEHYDAIVRKLRAAVPGIALSTDIIVGFPGETEADFEATAAYMRAVGYDSAFLFKYSARADTKAHRWPETVSEEEKGERLARLIEQQQQISGAINARLIGKTVEVLVEGPARKNPCQLYGKSAHFKTVVFPDDGTPAGTLARVRVEAATAVTLLAQPLTAGEKRAAEPLLRLA
jgi:tRNA-2-methylthio-N6-dimethylallyladenosine synthase